MVSLQALADIAEASRLQAEMCRQAALRAQAVERAAYVAWMEAHNAARQATVDSNWAQVLCRSAETALEEEKAIRAYEQGAHQ
jgi:hypothetical protein